MATKVHMEALSPTMEEGQVVKWLKGEGDQVTSGEILAEIETDKATMELVARGDGILRAILLGEGGTAPVGEVIAVIGGADEDISALTKGGAGAGAAKEGATAAESSAGADAGVGKAAPPETVAATAEAPAPATTEPAATPAGGDGSSGSGNGRVKASPLARRLADEAGLALSSVSGTGPGGRIVKKDIEAALAAGTPPPTAAAAAPALAFEGPEHVDIPLTQIRKTIARRLSESLGPVPHFFLTIDIDMGRAIEVRKSINAMLEERGEKVSFNDLIIKATAVALRHHPACNAWWMGDRIRTHNRVHLGIAVAIEDGLITPVVRDADRKGVAAIAREVKELAGRAREKRLKPEEYTGSTFSISNLGMFGIEEFTAVINPPEAGILAIGALEERAIVEGGQVVVRPRMRVTMSCDHRVIDGAQGSRFLGSLKALLEEPAAMLA